MKKKYDVVALGELLIDFAPGGMSDAGSPLFECNPGGAPANVLTAVVRQGGTGAFIGKVGEDDFGQMLKKTLVGCGVGTQGLLFDPEIRTTLAFVSLDSCGNRSFSFFRNPGADIMLRGEEVDIDLIRNARIFHFGSLSLTDEPVRSATRIALETAKKAGCTVSFDPNLRPPLWKTLEDAKEQITAYLPYADIVKISGEEFTFLTGESDLERHSPFFAEQYGIECLFITLGSKGAFTLFRGACDRIPTYDVKAVDTTGCGDAFAGAVLAMIAKLPDGLRGLKADKLRDITRHANACGALTARNKGAIPAIPDLEEVRKCVEETPLLFV